MADNSLDLNINIGANTQDFASQLQKAENLLSQFQSALKKSTNVGEINYLSTQINNLNGVIDNLNGKMSNMKKPTADSTNALSNFSRVAQDAPYGFMAISNNLNPMLESFQRLSKESGGAGNALKSMVSGLMSPAGLGVALGVVSSLIVAFGDDIANFVGELMHGEDATKQYKEAFKGIGGEFTSAVQRVNKVQVAFEEYHRGILTGEEALKIYNKELGATLGVKSNVNDAERIFKEKTADYIQSTLQRALADQASKKAAEELLKQKELQIGSGKYTTGDFFASMTYGVGATAYLNQKALENQAAAVAESQKIIDKYLSIQTEAQIKADEIAKKAGLITDPEEKNKDKNKNTEGETSRHLSTMTKIRDEYKEALIDFNKSIKQEEVLSEVGDTSKNEALNNKIRIYKDFIKNLSGIDTEPARAKMKEMLGALSGMIDQQNEEKELAKKLKLLQDIYKFWLENDKFTAKTSVSAMRDLISKQDAEREKETDKTPFSEKKIGTKNTAVDREENRIKKFDKDLKDSQEQAQKYAEFMASTLTGAFNAMFDALSKGENPLLALGGYIEDLVKKLAQAAIQAAIFQGILMAFGGGVGSFGEGFVGGFKKILGFAEGGVVSQPTLAMVGEGGQSEAVMPLNKLSNMMNSTFNAGAMSGVNGGGGNGQFVLKGNDLVLALQRSNYSLNLRRGNGI